MDQALLRDASTFDADAGADGVAIRFCADQAKTDALVSGEPVVSVEVRGSVVGGH